MPKVGLEEEDTMQRVLSGGGAAAYMASIEKSAPQLQQITTTLTALQLKTLERSPSMQGNPVTEPI